jgi:hypothetical protein
MKAWAGRHWFPLLVLAIEAVVIWLAWPRVGRCIWTGIIAAVALALYSLGRFFNNPDSFK